MTGYCLPKASAARSQSEVGRRSVGYSCQHRREATVCCTPVSLRTSSLLLFLENQDDAPLDRYRRIRDLRRARCSLPWRSRLAYLKGKTQFMGLRPSKATPGNHSPRKVRSSRLWTSGYLFDATVDSTVATNMYCISYAQQKKTTDYLWKSCL